MSSILVDKAAQASLLLNTYSFIYAVAYTAASKAYIANIENQRKYLVAKTKQPRQTALLDKEISNLELHQSHTSFMDINASIPLTPDDQQIQVDLAMVHDIYTYQIKLMILKS
jgi:hypothetical protein